MHDLCSLLPRSRSGLIDTGKHAIESMIGSREEGMLKHKFYLSLNSSQLHSSHVIVRH